MKLATEIRWQDSHYAIPVERIQSSEKWGYDAVFTAEGLGSDALTPLGYLAAMTDRLQLGTCIAQITARSPGASVMGFQTLSAISDGRVIAGFGSSSPIVTESLHTQPWGNPYHRMKDYVTLVRQGFRGEALDHAGRQITAPYRTAEGTPAQPAMATFLEATPDIPIILAAGGPQIITLAAELADGWFPVNFAPGMFEPVVPLLEAGFARAGNGKGFDDFDIWVHVDVIMADDVRAAMRPFKEYVVMWIELQQQQMIWRGYPDACARVLELKAAGHHDEAVDAVPDEYIDEGWLVGPLARITERLSPWLDCGATGLIVRYGPQGMNQAVPEPLEVFEAVAKRVHG